MVERQEVTELILSQTPRWLHKVFVSEEPPATNSVYQWDGGRWRPTLYAVPKNGIIMWSGLLTAIPAGWLLCDGTSGTPDLRGQFIKGSAAGIDPGVTGGALTHTHVGHAAHVVTQAVAHVFTQPIAHLAHVFTQPVAHVFTQAVAHAAHVFTQAINHVFTQPSGHSAHSALATHQHEMPFQLVTGTGIRFISPTTFGTGTSRAAVAAIASTASTVSAAVAFVQAVTGGTPSAHSAHADGAVDAHSGAAVDAHSAHAGASVDAHSGAGVDGHSAHSGGAVDAHSGTAVDAHSAHDTPNHEPPYYSLAFIMKS